MGVTEGSQPCVCTQRPTAGLLRQSCPSPPQPGCVICPRLRRMLRVDTQTDSRTQHIAGNKRARQDDAKSSDWSSSSGSVRTSVAPVAAGSPMDSDLELDLTCVAPLSGGSRGNTPDSGRLREGAAVELASQALALARRSPASEQARVSALLQLAIINTPAEAQFDSCSRAAADICEVPAALVTFVDASHTWFKSNLGFGDATHVDRSSSVCHHVVNAASTDLFVIEDLTKDPRTCNNPFVTGEPKMRFYAGAPLVDEKSGQVLGALCVIDYQPRHLSAVQRSSLQLLAKQVMAAAESRSRILNLQEAMEQLQEARNALAASKEHAEKAQRQAEHALALAEQANSAKSEFLANMSHEIRTPLNGVLGTASLLAETTNLDFEQKDYVRVIKSSGEHLLTVLNDILDFSKFESGKLEIDAGRVDLSAMLEQAIELSFKPKPSLELVYSVAPDVPPIVLGDVTRLRQICANLLSNASKFTLEGQIVVRVEVMSSIEIQRQLRQQASHGSPADSADRAPVGVASYKRASLKNKLQISPVDVGHDAHTYSHCHVAQAAMTPQASLTAAMAGAAAAASAACSGAPTSLDHSSVIQSPLWTPALHTPGGTGHDPSLLHLVFSVSDSGIGIAPSLIHRLFSAFTQLDVSITREYGGTGLGLAISARLAQLMGGTMWCKSEVGVGSTFYFSICTKPVPLMAPVSSSPTGTPMSQLNSERALPMFPLHAHPPAAALAAPHATHPLARCFPAWGELSANPAVASAVSSRSHAIVVERNDALRASLSDRLEQWGLVCIQYRNLAEANACVLTEPAVLQNRLAVLIASQPAKAGNTQDDSEADAYALLQKLRGGDSQMRNDGGEYRYIVPAVVLVHSQVAEEPPSGSGTGANSSPVQPAAAQTNGSLRHAHDGLCRVMLKPVLMSKLSRQLDKLFRAALFGTAAPAAIHTQASAELSSAVPSRQPSPTSANGNDVPVGKHAGQPVVHDVAVTAPPRWGSSQPNTPLASPIRSVRSLSSQYPLRVLIVEDNVVNMKLAARMLAALGYTDVAQSWNGAEALARFEAGEQYDVVLMDNIMPQMTGPQACKAILQLYQDRANAMQLQQSEPAKAALATGDSTTLLPVSPSVTHPPIIIALTASCMPEDRQMSVDSGHSDFIAKPLNLPLLKKRLQFWAKHIYATSKAPCADSSQPQQSTMDAASNGAQARALPVWS